MTRIDTLAGYLTSARRVASEDVDTEGDRRVAEALDALIDSVDTALYCLSVARGRVEDRERALRAEDESYGRLDRLTAKGE